MAALDTPANISLAAGSAGALLMQAHLFSLQATEQRRQQTSELLAALIHQVQAREMSTALWDGLTGILYAIEYTRTVAPDLISEPLAQFVEEMDELLIGYLSQSGAGQHFDVISGTAGIGAYALMRTDLDAARRLYSAVEACLLKQSTVMDAGRIWRTATKFMSPFASIESRTHGHIDLGLAHGQPGVVQLFAGAVRHGIATDDTRRYLGEATSALIALQSEPTQGCRYAYFDIHPGHSRLAWCYGDLSAAFSIYSAASVEHNEEWRAMARSLLLGRLQQPEESFGLEDAALCHGQAGVLHLVRKIAAHDPQPAYTRFVNERLAVLDNSDDEYQSRPGLLEGHAGVLLVLQDGPDGGRHHWDVCLCLGF